MDSGCNSLQAAHSCCGVYIPGPKAWPTCFESSILRELLPDHELYSAGIKTDVEVLPCPLSAISGHRATYSITSSARASADGGIVRPSALAVLRLITSSYLVGAYTGRSTGFSPLRNAVDIAGGAPGLVNHIGPIGDQAATGDEGA